MKKTIVLAMSAVLLVSSCATGAGLVLMLEVHLVRYWAQPLEELPEVRVAAISELS